MKGVFNIIKLTGKDVDLKGKKSSFDVDFNVPKDGVITNDNVTAALPTIKYIIEQGSLLLLMDVSRRSGQEGKSLAW